jgi:hypothetical protein
MMTVGEACFDVTVIRRADARLNFEARTLVNFQTD